MTEPEALLDLRGVAKRYGQVFALRGIDAKVARATKVVGLLGPNGAGKSTLVKCMLGLIPFDGHARVLGYDPRVDGAAIRARVGYMPESDVFLAGMSAVELCAYAAELSGLPRTEALQRAHASLYYAGLEDKRYQNVDGYSTGQKQRVKLAQALVHDPELLFLDEPTNGLDPRSRDEMLELIAELPEKRGCTIMISTHLLTDVDRVCDSALIMHLGQVRFSGTIEQLRTKHGGPALRDRGARAHGRAVRRVTARGAVAAAFSPVGLTATLPEDLTAHDVLALARAGQHAGAHARAAPRVDGAGVPAGRELVRADRGRRPVPHHHRRVRVTHATEAAPPVKKGVIHDLGYARYAGPRRPPSSELAASSHGNRSRSPGSHLVALEARASSVRGRSPPRSVRRSCTCRPTGISGARGPHDRS
jgi:ABC-2 type transport system ATP-binding protein